MIQTMHNATATLLISRTDRPRRDRQGKANFIYANRGNITHAKRHTDFNTGLFLNRL